MSGTADDPSAPLIPAAPSPGPVLSSAPVVPAVVEQAPTAIPLLAVLVLATAILLWVAFQAYALLGERENLMAGATQIASQVEAATKVRASIDSIAAGVKRLSEGGNPNARIIVDELARRGVTINPNATQPPAPGK